MRLPRGSGIVFRHYHLGDAARKRRFETIKMLARRHGHRVFLAGTPALARHWRAEGVYGCFGRRSEIGALLHGAPVHNAREIQKANRAGADIFFLSPIFATRSHPGQPPMNPVQVRRLSALCNGAVIGLGGMNQHRYRFHKNRLTHGWAAIDAFS
ncbi:thiamine phosphate synthase [Parasphingorhabdus sp.]|uniref:thiamine phosphate synthase n=1 Tax=Parasphingorhabdus sp. TaxID=2709688 RepID=UPI003A9436A0